MKASGLRVIEASLSILYIVKELEGSLYMLEG